MVRGKILDVKAEIAAGRKPKGQKTIFYDLFLNDDLAREDKTVERLEVEGVGLVAAGSNTVAHTLTVISFHLINDKAMLEKLQMELATVIPEPDSQPTHRQLEQLPYLTAVITEGLRWGYGVTERLQRISPDVALKFHNWVIPPGTPVGMTSVMMHDNHEIFPNPREFEPGRWLQPNSRHLQKYLVPFSKGSRKCLGMK